ncbi:MAG: response regulator [Candidatus Marinimicrobia bacterium]|nr:response regulator [Candidatus Neomarinimicrobiota bacterium]
MSDFKVLYVDDSHTMRRILKNSLNKVGFNDLIEAENGREALEKLLDVDVDLIVTDWNMPEMNGEKMVVELRGNPKYKDIPILMVTTRGMKEDVITAVKIGVNGYMVKPFTPEILKKKINDILSK